MNNKRSICIVLCSKGYPEKYKKNIQLNGLDNLILKENQYIFHAGTIKESLKTFSNGGRVLNFVTTSSNFKNARDKVINLIEDLNWENGFYRKDIGYKVIDK